MAPATRYRCKTCNKCFIKDFFVSNSNDNTYELCLFCLHHADLNEKINEGMLEIKELKDQNKVLSDKIKDLMKHKSSNDNSPNLHSGPRIPPPPGFQPRNPEHSPPDIRPLRAPPGYPQPLLPANLTPSAPPRSPPFTTNHPLHQTVPTLRDLNHFPPLSTPAQPFKQCGSRKRVTKKQTPVPQSAIKLTNRYSVLKEVEDEGEGEQPTPSPNKDVLMEDSSMVLGDSLLRGVGKFLSRPKTKRTVHVYPGARINNIKETVKEIALPDKKSCLVVNVGSNDIFRKTAATEHYVADYVDLIDTLKDRADNIAIVGVLPRWKVGNFALSRAIHVNNRIKKYCQQKANISFIDPWDEFINARDLYQRDGTHPSTKGTKLLASMIETNIFTQLKSKNFC